MSYLLKTLMLLISFIILSSCSASEAELCNGDNCALVRFKAITVLEVDGELKEFYNVLQAKVVRLEEGQSALGFGGRSKVWSEATVIDLGEKGRAYILNISYRPNSPTAISSIYPQALLTSFGSKANLGNMKKEDVKILKQASKRYEFKMPGSRKPTFVYFSDEADENSVKHLPLNQLSEVFGDGVKFLGFYIEKTNEEITDGKIIKYLPWLKLHSSQLFETPVRGVKRSDWRLSWRLSKSAFVMPEHINKSK